MNPPQTTAPRLIKRKLPISPSFHQTDMMGVIHNSVYFLWFEEGRMRILLEILPIEEALALGAAMPVVRNVCHYRKPVKFGMPLELYTTHRVSADYEGRLVFKHYLLHQKLRVEMAWGESVVTMVDHRTNQLVKTWPDAIRQRYLALK